MGIALDAADQSDVRVGIDEHLHVAQFAHPCVDEEQDPVDNDDVGGIHTRVFGAAEMRDEIVLGLIDRPATAE